MTHTIRPRSRRGIATAVTLGLGLVAGAPALANTEFLGGGYLVPRAGCEPFGWVGAHQVLVRMQPQGFEGNDRSETQLSLLLGTGTIAYRFNDPRAFRRDFEVTQAVYVWNGPWAPEDPAAGMYYNMNSSILSGPDATELTEYALVLTNFNEHEGCSVFLYANLHRR